MNEEVTIINTNTRNEKIKNFFIKNKQNLVIAILVIFIMLIGFFVFDKAKQKKKTRLANQYNSAVINYSIGKKENIVEELTYLVNEKDKTYSPLSLYFLIDNNLIENRDEVNNLFNILIQKTSLETEIKDLIIYKKALFNSEFLGENELIQILNPIINSKSTWKSHALYLMAEYFYSKNEREKSKEFFNQVIALLDGNSDIKLESQKRLNRDFGE